MRLFISLMFVSILCSCSSLKKSSNNVSDQNQDHPPFLSSLMGLGPVNIAASNFFFKGELKQENGKLCLYDCFTAQIIAINPNSTIYKELFSKFQSIYASPVYVNMRGFLTNNKGKTELTATYLNNIYEVGCSLSENITGNWISDSMSTSAEGISLTIKPNYTFVLKFALPQLHSTIRGEWQMMNNISIFFSFQEINQYFSHNGTLSDDNKTIVISTDFGAISLKKR